MSYVMRYVRHIGRNSQIIWRFDNCLLQCCSQETRVGAFNTHDFPINLVSHLDTVYNGDVTELTQQTAVLLVNHELNILSSNMLLNLVDRLVYAKLAKV